MAVTLYELALKLTTNGVREATKGLAEVDTAGKKTALSLTSLEANASRASRGLLSAASASTGASAQMNLAGGASKLLAGGLAVFAGGSALTAGIQLGLGLIAAGYRALSTEGQLATEVAGKLADKLRQMATARFQATVQGKQGNELGALSDLMKAEKDFADVGQRWFGNRRIYDAALERLRDAQRNYAEATLQTAEAVEKSASRQVTAINSVRVAHERAGKAVVDQTTPNRGPHMDIQGLPLGADLFPTGPMPNIGRGSVTPLDEGANAEIFQKAQARMEQIQDFMSAQASILQHGIADTIGGAIYDGFAAAFNGEGLGGVFKAFGKSILASIGNILGQMGQVWLEYGVLMTGLGQALWNPFTSGPAAIAIGAALMALSGALGAVAHGGGGARSGTSAYSTSAQRTEDITRYKFIDRSGNLVDLSPRPAMHFTIIGPNDPSAQRAIGEVVEKYNRRTA